MKIVLVSVLLASSIAAASDVGKLHASGALEFDYGKCIAVVRAIDSFGKPVPGAVIEVRIRQNGPHGDTQVHSKADSEGNVRFLGLPEAKIPFSAAADGRRATLLIDTASQCEGNATLSYPSSRRSWIRPSFFAALVE